jgi:RNA polymerase sigma-70 factor (ECF subfamily)
LQLLGNSEDAEDAVQEGLLAALRHLQRSEGRSPLIDMADAHLVNAALMRLRTLRAHAAESIDDLAMQQGKMRFSDVLVDKRANAEEAYARMEQRRILNRGLQGLSRAQRRALSLHDFQGMTNKETAEAWGLSEGTVKSQVHRARQKLLESTKRLRQARALTRLAAA